MAIYLSTKFATAEEFEKWLAEQEHGNKEFLDKLCEADKEAWDNKACNIAVKNGKLQLLCAKGNVLAEADYVVPDNDTVCCDETGAIKVRGLENANKPNGKKIRIWAGTQEEYDAILKKDANTFYYITNDTTKTDLKKAIEDISKHAENIKKNTEDIKGIFDGSKAVGKTNAMNYVLKAKGSWASVQSPDLIKTENIISATNFIKPNTRYLIKADGRLIDGFSNEAGTQIYFDHISANIDNGVSDHDVSCAFHMARILYKEGTGVYFIVLHTFFSAVLTSGSYKYGIPITHIFEGETINI